MKLLYNIKHKQIFEFQNKQAHNRLHDPQIIYIKQMMQKWANKKEFCVLMSQ